jgi:Type II secretion system (T2SS), protein N
MPASPSRSRAPKPPPPAPRRFWPFILLGCGAVAALVLIVLPASLISRFLPPQIHAEDFSGSIWHGSSGHVAFMSRPVGALEWHLHPMSLLSLGLSADVRWVKGSSVIGGSVSVDRHGFEAHDVRGGGPLEDFRDFGGLSGWSGNAKLDLQQIKGSFQNLESAAGHIEVSALAFTQIAKGADLGSYELTVAPGADPSTGLAARVQDAGGPLELQAEVHYAPASHSGTLSGTLRERADASPALREQLAQLAQMRPRDGEGRIPLELEFAL